MELNSGETVLFQGHPSWRAALLFFVKGFIGAAIVGVIVGFAVSTVTGTIVGAAIFGLTVAAGIVIRSATEYVITDERLHIRKGLLSRSVQETRLARVQDVSLNQTVWERMLRIGRADFDTASSDHNDFVFAGIEHPDRVRAAVDAAHRLAEQRGLEPPAPGAPARPHGAGAEVQGL